jgi:iron(III) transport system permease protein
MKKRGNKSPLVSRFDSWTIVTLAAAILIIIFIIYPFSVMVIRSVVDKEGGFNVQHYIKFFKSKYYMTTLFNSLKVSLTATLLALIIGVPMAYATSRFKLKGKSIIDNMCILVMLSPPFIGAYSWIVLLGRNGFITNILKNITGIQIPSIYGFRGILLVFTLKLFPYVYLYVSGALGNIDASLEECAESLGVSNVKRLFTISFPLILPTILSSALMVFMTSLADFGTPALIGEGYRVLPVSIYDEYVGEMGGNTGFANALSVVIIFVALLVLNLQKKVISGRNYNMSALRAPVKRKLTPVTEVIVSALVFLVALVSILPQITVAVTSFINTSGPVFLPGFGLNSYIEAFSKLSTAIRNTFLLSIVAITIMILLALLLAYLAVRRSSKLTNLIDSMIMFPYVIPGAVVGIMLVSAFNRPPILLTGTAAIMIVSYIIRKLPFTLRSSIGILYQIEKSVEEASISLGVPPMRTFFKITARMMMPGVISGAILSWLGTINELSSSMILYTGRTMTISVAIYNEVTSKAHFGTAAALATILTISTILFLWLAKKISGGKVLL